MSCRDTIHLICWYLEGRLSSSVETEIRRHLEACSDCRLVLEAAVNTLDRYFNPDRSEASGDAFRAALFIAALAGNPHAANQAAALHAEATRPSANSTICRANASFWL